MSAPVLDGQARSGFARIACSTDAQAAARTAELAGPGRVLDLLGLTSSADHDLLVLGADEYQAVEATVPILVARAVPAGAAFPGDVLVVSDGTAASRPVIAATAALVAGHRSHPMLLHVGRADRATRRELAEQAATLRMHTGVPPVALSSTDDAPRAVARLSAGLRIAVVVVAARFTGVVASATVPVLLVP